jgi:hypothetical protein
VLRSGDLTDAPEARQALDQRVRVLRSPAYVTLAASAKRRRRRQYRSSAGA